MSNAQPTTTIPTALYERMVGLITDVGGSKRNRTWAEIEASAREIAKELPVEVDADRQIVIDHYLDAGVTVTNAALDLAVQILKRGRQLERGE